MFKFEGHLLSKLKGTYQISKCDPSFILLIYQHQAYQSTKSLLSAKNSRRDFKTFPPVKIRIVKMLYQFKCKMG